MNLNQKRKSKITILLYLDALLVKSTHTVPLNEIEIFQKTVNINGAQQLNTLSKPLLYAINDKSLAPAQIKQ